MLGPRVGPVVGPKPGGAVGPAANEIARLSGGVPQDGPNSWYVPASSADFTALGIAAPAALWQCQDAVGPYMTDSVGSLPLLAVGGDGYQAAVAGWSRKAVTVAAGASMGFGRAVAEEPNAAARSVLWLAYIDLTAGAGSSRCIVTASDSAGATELSGRHAATNVTQVKCLGVSTNGAAAINPSGGVIAYALLYDRTNSRVGAFTNAEKVLGTYGAGVVDGNKGFRSGVANAPGMSIVWACCWTDVDAELSDAQLKTRLQALGIAIPWS